MKLESIVYDPVKIIWEGLLRYSPVKVVLMFSGGHDSLCATHLAASYLTQMGIPFIVYHGNTGIGIRQTREYVYSVVKQFGWDFYEGHPKAGETYRDIVKKHGFPGPTPLSHRLMYIRLKERALKHFVTHVCKSEPKKRENVLLLTGIRRTESKIRMGYSSVYTKQNSCCWASHIFYWTQENIDRYMQLHNLPRNPVKDKICISGECLCGAWAKKSELTEIKASYPEAAEKIAQLHQLAKDNGKPWGWASGPNEWFKNNPKGQMKMFMCIGCEEKREQNYMPGNFLPTDLT